MDNIALINLKEYDVLKSNSNILKEIFDTFDVKGDIIEIDKDLLLYFLNKNDNEGYKDIILK